jgi:hypothetical protein
MPLGRERVGTLAITWGLPAPAFQRQAAWNSEGPLNKRVPLPTLSKSPEGPSVPDTMTSCLSQATNAMREAPSQAMASTPDAASPIASAAAMQSFTGVAIETRLPAERWEPVLGCSARRLAESIGGGRG